MSIIFPAFFLIKAQLIKKWACPFYPKKSPLIRESYHNRCIENKIFDFGEKRPQMIISDTIISSYLSIHQTIDFNFFHMHKFDI